MTPPVFFCCCYLNMSREGEKKSQGQPDVNDDETHDIKSADLCPKGC